MPDNILLVVFGILSIIALIISGIALYFAIVNAKKKDKELQMAFWTTIALAGLTFAGMSLAYFIIPILTNWLF